MTDKARQSLPLGENHRRGVSTTLVLLDELLCLVEDWASGRKRKGILYEEHNNLSPPQRRALLRETARIRRRLATARHDLELNTVSQDAASDIWSHCSAFRENLMELGGHHLRRYGQATPKAEAYMDSLSRDLLDGLDRLLLALGTSGRGAS